MVIHPGVTPQRVLAACDRYLHTTDNPGFCLDCAHEAADVEPDARRDECPECGSFAVYGAEELSLCIVL